MKKLKGIKFKRVDGVINDFPQIKCKDGTLSYSVMGCENRGGGVAEPQSVTDCPPGSWFVVEGEVNKCVQDIDDYGYEAEPKDLQPKDVSASPIKTMGLGGSNWLLPAILVGVGIYMITRKSQ